ncbi:MAG TPA: hypothetical protein VJO35_18555 [Terriglobales bacterium]|nr:hypothetical protein [Terriglobales bacterium]
MKACFRLLLFTMLCVSFSFSQDSDIPSSLSNSDNGLENQEPNQSLGDLARHVRKDHTEDTKMTEEDAKKLFTAVDQIAKFASDDSGFPLHSPVKRRMISPDDLEDSARANLNKQEYADRFARSELTMKKFGLLPRDFDLKEFLIKVQRKEIAAYYDDDTKTISLLNTIPVEQQEAILAHELTHALQDQNYDLKKWMKAESQAGNGTGSMDGSDESSTARRAVIEGQATVVFIDYLLAKLGRNIENTPGIIYRMEDPAVKYAVDSQMMHDAPMLLREWGTFPYREGLIFEGELLQAGSKKLAFQGVFAHPPRTTHEVIQPRAYLDHETLAPIPIPDAKAILGDGYELYDSGSLGELDVRALLWQLGTRTLADDLSKNWRGGSYVAFRKKSSAAASISDLKLLYVSRWSSPEAAQRFANFYVKAVSRRYQTATPDANVSCAAHDCPAASAVIATEEGPIMIDQWKDSTVLVAESFDRNTAAKLVDASRDMAQKSAGISVPQQELGMRLYDLPAFRAFEERAGEQMFRRFGSVSAVRAH